MSDERGFPNRRQFRRVPFPFPAIVVAEGEVETAPVRDLSLGGMFILAPRPRPVGSVVQVEFDVGTRQRFVLLGTVVRHGPSPAPGFAVEFQIDEAVRSELGGALGRCA